MQVEVKKGRPNKFTSVQVRAIKAIVRRYGLREGHKALKEMGWDISLPTLGKYVHSSISGNPVPMRRGRPRLASK